MTDPKSPPAEQIQQRAFELYLERGGQDGYDVEDWLAAESELKGLSELSASSTAKALAASAN